MLHTFAALAIAAAVPTAAANEPPHKTLIVQLVHRIRPGTPNVPGRILAIMKNEAERIWLPLDVRIAWVDSTDANAMEHPAGLTVFIEEGEYPLPHASGDLVLGALTQPTAICGWGLAHVWVRHVERHAALARRDGAGLPAAMAETFLGRALGRALAHEIGHYLLGTREHSAHGLMRPRFTPQDLLEEATRPLYRLDATAREGLLSCRTEQETESEDR
ncbi:MAG TPA: hypothetical protein VKD69_11775 [Vicinamibacterales bacterium]|nr:hypothetical protein [Vicinamibacterales bacterium]